MVNWATIIIAGSLSAGGDYGKVMGDGLDLVPPGSTSDAITNPCPSGPTLTGIDVSYYQGDVDWNAVAGDVDFAFIRVSHSLEFFDPQFDTNWANARAAGVHAGVYQYFEPDEDPVAQADLLLDSMGPLMPGDLPPVIDVESVAGQSGAQIEAAVAAWIDHVEAELGVKPIIYSNGYFWQDNVGSDAFGDYPLWIAHYGTECPNTPSPWTDWTVHQFTDSGSVSGVSGPVDTNVFDGSVDDLIALGTGEAFVCGTLGPDGGVIDNGDECYRLHGNPDYWRDETAGIGGSLVWTNATDFAQASNYATIDLWFEEAGDYELTVSIVAPYGETQQAPYRITHADGQDEVIIDQSANDGWVSLGTFSFEAETRYLVRLDDNTGEPNDGEIGIVFDALEATRIGGGDDGSDDGGDDGPQDDDGDDGGGDSGDDDGPPDGGDNDGDGDPSDSGGGEDDGEGTGGGDDGGPSLPAPADCIGDDCDTACACSSDSIPPSPLWATVILLVARRRRCER